VAGLVENRTLAGPAPLQMVWACVANIPGEKGVMVICLTPFAQVEGAQSVLPVGSTIAAKEILAD
jgi:hypothetical protein